MQKTNNEYRYNIIPKYPKWSKYLNICRKDSLGYVEFIMGKYQLYNNLH